MNNFILSMLDLPKPRSQLRPEGRTDSIEPSSPDNDEDTNPNRASEAVNPRSTYGVITTPIRESLDSKSLVKLLSAEKVNESSQHDQTSEVETPYSSPEQLKHDSAIKFLACATDDHDISFIPALRNSEEVDIISEVEAQPSKAIEYSVKFPAGPMGLELEVSHMVIVTFISPDNAFVVAGDHFI
jgi:hypothetical protein